MTDNFSADFFVNNRKRLRALVSDAELIIVTANGLLQRSADSTFQFQQDASFWYLTGIDEPDITLVMDGNQEYLLVPNRSDSRQAFDGVVDATQLEHKSGIAKLLEEEQGRKELSPRLSQITAVGLLQPAPAYIEQYGMYTNPARAVLASRVKDANDQLQVVDIRPQLAQLRAIKQPTEIAAIKQAIQVTALGLEEVIDNLSLYEHEYEIEADLSRSFRFQGARGHAFAPIVASGKRACTLHNVANNGKLSKGELVVIDIGADYEHYAADITRTIAYGKANVRQQAIYDAVLEVQEYALSLIKPGALLKENEQQIEAHMAEKLRGLGLIESADHEAVRKYFPHATSHFLGLDVHDVGDYQQPLQAGMVITNEPGIYIPEESIGVRVEDDVLITENGAQVLSDAIPRILS